MNAIVKPASDKQLKWLRDLLVGHDFSAFPADWRDYCDYIKRAFELCEGEGFGAGSLNVWLSSNDRDEVTQATFKKLLPRLQEAPKVGSAAPQAKLPDATVVPAGRYCVPTEEGSLNELAFYKVDRPTEGRWAGRVFVKLLLSDNEQRISWDATKTVLAKIAAIGAEKSSAAYGHEIGECGVCGRTLTNDESRARGIGPICVAKMGW